MQVAAGFVRGGQGSFYRSSTVHAVELHAVKLHAGHMRALLTILCLFLNPSARAGASNTGMCKHALNFICARLGVRPYTIVCSLLGGMAQVLWI